MTGERDRGPLLPVVAVIALLGAGLLAAAFGNPAIEALPRQLVPTTAAPAARETVVVEESGVAEPVADETPRPPSRSPAPTVLAIAVLLTLIAAAVVGYWLRRSRAPVIHLVGAVRPAPPHQVRRLLSGAVDQGLEALAETDADPRRAVIACWARLESVAMAAGKPRRPGDTSTDLVLRLLGEHRVSGDVLAGFAAVYREARFATHLVDESMRRQAQMALSQLRTEIAAAVGVGRL